MKRALYITLAVSLLLIISCAANTSPHRLVKQFYKAIDKGDYNRALSYTNLIDEVDAELYYAIMEKVSKSIEIKGGVKSIEIVDEQINDEGTHAIIATIITYGDGSEDQEYCDLFLQEDGWVIDANLYAK